MKIYFEDQMQDFLEWELDEKGFVIDSKPFQNWVWKGTKVILVSVRLGMRPMIVTKSDITFPIDSPEKKFLEVASELNYKVIKIDDTNCVEDEK